MSSLSPREIFSGIYERNAWIVGSGEGSLPENTIIYRTFLQHFLQEKKIQTVLDIGCGDWQLGSRIDWSGIEYVGIDIVPSVIEMNRRRYPSEHLSFVCADATTERLPPADLLLIKDVLQHWPNDTILCSLSSWKECRYVLLTNDVCDHPTIDCVLGSHRPINLALPPFSLPLTEVLRYDVHEYSQAKTTTKVVCLLEHIIP